MRWIQERLVLGSARTGVSNSTSDIWLLGVRYNVSSDDETVGLASFEQDFSSRVIMTYRKGLFQLLDVHVPKFHLLFDMSVSTIQS